MNPKQTLDALYDPLNVAAANWWAERLGIPEKREAFRGALMAILPEDNWTLYSDYDPFDLLLKAVHLAGIECRGCLFSSRDLLPYKTWLKREDGWLLAKEGYGAPTTVVHWRDREFPRL